MSLHALLSENRDEIIARCEGRYRQRHPDRPREELLHTIPRFLDEVIAAERVVAGLAQTSHRPGATEEARAHGEQRFRFGYRIEEIARDYGTICDVVTEIALERKAEFDLRSYKVLAQCVDAGIAQSISEYFELSQARGDREVAEWIGVLAHELRNAVSSAIMAHSFVKTGQVGLDSKTARVLERSLHRVEALVCQMLVASRLRGPAELVREPVELTQLIEEVEAAAVPERGIAIRVAIEDAVTLIGDPGLLSSAVSNLVQNALKFTRDRGQIEIRVSASEAGVEIAVEDECGGLPDDHLEELFAPFVQRGSRTRGIGLGLSITKQAIEAHGGHVTVRNVPGHGCVFTIWLPVPDREARGQPAMDGRDAWIELGRGNV